MAASWERKGTASNLSKLHHVLEGVRMTWTSSGEELNGGIGDVDLPDFCLTELGLVLESSSKK